MLRFLILFSLIVSGVTGCAFFSNYDQIMLLKRLGDDRKEMERDVRRQEKLFYKLKDDVRHQRLIEGTPKKRILAIYGEPIDCKNIKNEPGISESCLYRHPTEFFSGDKVHLKFDQDQNLKTWDLESEF